MKSIFKISIVILSFSSFSCTDLTEEVYSSSTENNYVYVKGDATKLVGAAFANLRSGLTYTICYAQSITTDEALQPANASGWDDGGVYKRMHLHNWNSEQSQIKSIWQHHFTGVLLSCDVIEKLSSGKVPIDETKGEDLAQLIAEMRALRAYHYWNLLDNFGEVPLMKVISTVLLPKSTKQEIYDFVVAELLESINVLTEEKVTANYGRINKWGAKTILANVYLNSESYIGITKWNECLKECDDIISSNKYKLSTTYSENFITENQKSEENIFVVPFDEIYATGFNHYKTTLHASSKATFNLLENPWGAGAYKAVPAFIDTYSTKDLRLNATWLSGKQYNYDKTKEILCTYEDAGKPLIFENKMPDGIYTKEGEGFRFLKYEIRNGAMGNLSNDWVIFRYAQVLMMKAECLLRTGKSNDAATIVTEVRQRAFEAGDIALATVTGAELEGNSSYKYGNVVNYILSPQTGTFPAKFGRFYDELGYEFAGEMFRRRDMIRFGHYTKARWLSHESQGDYRVFFPIPQSVVDANSMIKQNENY